GSPDGSAESTGSSATIVHAASKPASSNVRAVAASRPTRYMRCCARRLLRIRVRSASPTSGNLSVCRSALPGEWSSSSRLMPGFSDHVCATRPTSRLMFLAFVAGLADPSSTLSEPSEIGDRPQRLGCCKREDATHDRRVAVGEVERDGGERDLVGLAARELLRPDEVVKVFLAQRPDPAGAGRAGDRSLLSGLEAL